MQYWLLKSEPTEWSWDKQLARGEVGEPWTGVRNYQAQGFLKKMKRGDQCFFYHSGKRKEIVGVVEVIKSFEPDPTDLSKRFGMVTVRAMYPMTPVTLKWVKAQRSLQTMKLVMQPRLSVQPVSDTEWTIIKEQGIGA